jgi:hypothetical protein
VKSLDRREIGDGKPGEVTQRFISAFRELAGSTGASID